MTSCRLQETCQLRGHDLNGSLVPVTAAWDPDLSPIKIVFFWEKIAKPSASSFTCCNLGFVKPLYESINHWEKDVYVRNMV